jgi:hypothetical protein
MKDPFFIGLPSWIIQDGNYADFKRGDQAAFALEFASIESFTAASGKEVALERLHGSIHRIVGKVIHVREAEWWAIDAGIRMYREGRPPQGVEEGCWVSGEAYIGVDPFQYSERHSRHHTAPGLIYDWTINKIEINTAPYIKVEAGHRIRDPARPGWREIEATNAWNDGTSADYVLHCKLLDNPPRR